MSSNNLRIIYNNLVDLPTSTVSASSSAGSTPVGNLKLDSKSKLWRSSTSTTTTVKTYLVVTVSSSIIGGVVLPFSNLTSSATIRLRGYTGTAPTLGGTVDSPTFSASGTLVFDTGSGVSACPYQSFNLYYTGSTPTGANTYAFGGGTYARAYVPLGSQVACTSLLIEINDTNPSKYVEAGRLIVGPYWSPKYNTSFGMTSNYKDLSTHLRTESGDLITNRGTRSSSISMDLKYMDTGDRSKLYELIRGGGLARPIFISLFPENSDDYDLEQLYQVYGKLPQLSGIQYANFLQYSSQLELEEV